MKKIFAPLIAVAMALILFVICVCSTLCFALGDSTTAYADDTSAQSDNIVISSVNDLAGKTFYFNETLDFTSFATDLYFNILPPDGLTTLDFIYTYDANTKKLGHGFFFAGNGMGLYGVEGASGGLFTIFFRNTKTNVQSWGDNSLSILPRSLKFPNDLSTYKVLAADNAFSSLSAFLSAYSTTVPPVIDPPVEYTYTLNWYLDNEILSTNTFTATTLYSDSDFSYSFNGDIALFSVNNTSISFEHTYTALHTDNIVLEYNPESTTINYRVSGISYTDLLVNYYLDDTVVHSSILSVPSDYTSDSLTSNLSGSTVSVTVNYGSYTSTVSYNYNSTFDTSKSRFVVNKSTNSANYYAYTYEYKSAYIAWYLDNKHIGFSDTVSVPANLNDSLITTALVGNSIIDFQITDYDGSKIKFSYSYSKDIDFLNSYYEITTSGDGFIIKYYAVSVPPPTLIPPSFDGFDSDLTEEDFFGALTKLFNLFQLTLAQIFTFGILSTDINPVFQYFVAVLMIILTLDILKRLNIV